MKKIGVIIVGYNSRPYIDELFFSLSKVKYPNWEIVFIDNASQDDGADYLKEKFGAQFSNLTIMKVDKNGGFATGNNIGFEYLEAHGFEYAYLLNQDTSVEPDFLERALEKMRDGVASVQSLIFVHPSMGILSALKSGQDAHGRVNTLGNAIHFLGFGYCYGYGWSRERAEKFLENWRARDPELNIAYGSGAGILYDMEALKKIGYFDDDYFMYHEDLDLGWRLRLAGYKNVLAPESKIYHKYEFSKSIKKYYFMERNRYITIFKNYSAWTLFLIAPALILMEAGLFIFSLASGFWREKLRVYDYFLRPKNCRRICEKRKKIQKSRKISDKEISKYFVSKIEFQDLKNVILDKIANPLFTIYWQIIKSVL